MSKLDVSREMERREIAAALQNVAMRLGYFGDGNIYYNFAEEVLQQKEKDQRAQKKREEVIARMTEDSFLDIHK